MAGAGRAGRAAAGAAGAGAGSGAPLMVRAASGAPVERTPAWLMRQAGRYMPEFRAYSDKYPFRHRSETPEIAIELSLQPWRAFRPDGVVMFSDILTPLPGLGIEFDVVKGKGPVIPDPVRTAADLAATHPLEDPSTSHAFVGETLQALRQEVGEEAAVLGFVGSPWTLAAYAMEGAAQRHLRCTKEIMTQDPETLHGLLERITESLITYANYQVDSGAHVVQLFESWGHHLTPAQFQEFALPYSERVAAGIKAAHLDTPVITYVNGGTGKLHLLRDSAADVVGLDWATDMAVARETLGRDVPVQGNIDPMVLFAPEDVIRREVAECLEKAGPTGHILNVGNGIIQGTPPENVGLLFDLVRESAHTTALA